MEVFYWEKAFHAGKKSGKMTLLPQKNFPVTPLLYSGPGGSTLNRNKPSCILELPPKQEQLYT